MKTIELINKIYNSWMDNDSIDTDTPTGLRVMNIGARKIGDNIRNSNRWDDGNDTGEELNGTCTIQLQRMGSTLTIENVESAVSHIMKYHAMGDTIIMVIGEGCEGGEDERELIISNAKICDIICNLSEIKSQSWCVETAISTDFFKTEKLADEFISTLPKVQILTQK